MDEQEHDAIAELERRLRFADGQLHMMVAFVIAIIDTHPDPEELARRFELFAQTTIAQTESILVPEEYLDGELDISGRLKRALAIAQERKGPLRKDRDPA